jgi:hypothetical protein
VKRASRELLKELTDLLAEGHTQDQIANIMNQRGVTTPNGAKWSVANVSHYKLTHNLAKRAKLSNSMIKRHASGEMNRYRSSNNDSIEKIKTLLALNLSSETTAKAIQEVL